MKLHYYAETDSLYIELKETPGTETREVAAGLVVDLDAKGDVVGFDIDGASRRFDLYTAYRLGADGPHRGGRAQGRPGFRRGGGRAKTKRARAQKANVLGD